MAEIAGIKFAPLNIPLERRLQTLAVMYYMFVTVFMVPLIPFFGLLLPMYILFCTKYWFLIVAYVAWLYYDWDSPKTGGHPIKWFRKLPVHKYYAQ